MLCLLRWCEARRVVTVTPIQGVPLRSPIIHTVEHTERKRRSVYKLASNRLIVWGSRFHFGIHKKQRHSTINVKNITRYNVVMIGL